MRQQTFEEGKNCIEIGLGGDRTTRAVVLNLFMARGTLGQLYQYLAAPLDAKIDLKIRKLITGGTPDTNTRHPNVPRHPGREPLS